MPINYQDILGDIAKIASAAPQFEQELQTRRQEAQKLFSNQIDQGQLKDQLTKAASILKHLRCALPTAEAINQRFPLPTGLKEQTIIAVDGSQINPSRHLPVDYFLLNLGVIIYPIDPDGVPTAKRQSRLCSAYDESWKGINDSKVAYLRDIEERKLISEEARLCDASKGVITLTDGPLELWLRKGDGVQSRQQKEKELAPYLASLAELNELGAVTAGYVDKPRAMLVVEALEIGKLAPGELDQLRDNQLPDYHQFAGVTDRDLFAPLLTEPGDRSAVFELQFSEAKIYRDAGEGLGLHFFYLNVSQESSAPLLARVEIPEWVAADRDMLAALQTTLFRQCEVLGDVRYPYVLHRAHEEAVVTYQDREELDRLLIEEFARNGIRIGALSNKQTAKNLSTGKKRYSHGKRKY
jgi:hypothetical protein